MTGPGVRAVNGAGALACGGLMLYALYAQHGLGLEPCPLCIFQRLAVIALGILFLGGAMYPLAGLAARVQGIAIGLVALAGIGVAARHIWLQSLPESQVPACGPGLEYIMGTFPLWEALQMVFAGSGECAEVDWAFLGLSMPGWVLFSLLLLGGLGLWNSLRSVSLRG